VLPFKAALRHLSPTFLALAAGGADSVVVKRWSSGGWDDEVSASYRVSPIVGGGVAHAAGAVAPVLNASIAVSLNR
jgi:hypothetical protein